MGIAKNLSNQLRKFKEEHDLSLEECAACLGVGRTALQEYLTERGNPTLSTIEQLARGMGISPAALLAPEEAMEVTEVVLLGRARTGYPRCPGCRLTLEREYVAFCDRCGQKLNWNLF